MATGTDFREQYRSRSRSKGAPAKPNIVEQAALWLLVAGLAWVPFWYGGNALFAWGVNAVAFPGLAAAFEISLLLRGKRHPVGIRHVAVPAALFVTVLVCIGLQNTTFVPKFLVNPIWGMTSDVLGRPVKASISVNRDLTSLAMLRLLTAASVFWIALQLCRSGNRARRLVASTATIICAYAAYGLIAAKGWQVPWLGIASDGARVSSTFVNRDSFATYAGIGLVATCGVVLRRYRDMPRGAEEPWRLQLAGAIHTTGRSAAIPLGGGFVILVALLLSGSRGGILATGLGLLAIAALELRRGSERRVAHAPLVIILLSVLVTVVAFGANLATSFEEGGIFDPARMAVYRLTLQSIGDAPLLGHGYGTFVDVFPMYRDRSIGIQGIWAQAHDTYLEIFQGLGIVFGSMLLGCALLLVLQCFGGATTRRRGVMVPQVTAAAAVLVGVHALIDFSLQIQAVTLTFAALLGAGVAQSKSSLAALED